MLNIGDWQLQRHWKLAFGRDGLAHQDDCGRHDDGNPVPPQMNLPVDVVCPLSAISPHEDLL